MSLSGSQDRHLLVKISIASKIKAYKDTCLILQKVAHPAPLSPNMGRLNDPQLLGRSNRPRVTRNRPLRY